MIHCWGSGQNANSFACRATTALPACRLMQLYNSLRKASFINEMPKENVCLGFFLYIKKMHNIHQSLLEDKNKQDALLVFASPPKSEKTA